MDKLVILHETFVEDCVESLDELNVVKANIADLKNGERKSHAVIAQLEKKVLQQKNDSRGDKLGFVSSIDCN